MKEGWLSCSPEHCPAKRWRTRQYLCIWRAATVVSCICYVSRATDWL